MVGRGAFALMIISAVACSSSPPEDIDYPPLPDRHRTDSSETSPLPKSAMLEAADASTGRSDPFDRTAIEAGTPDARGGNLHFDAAIDGAMEGGAVFDASACAIEIEPNDIVASALSYGKTCGTLDGQGDVDHFVFYPSKAIRLTVVSVTGFAAFFVDDTMGGGHYQVAPGQTITVGPSSNAWVATATAPKAVSYVILLEDAP